MQLTALCKKAGRGLEAFRLTVPLMRTLTIILLIFIFFLSVDGYSQGITFSVNNSSLAPVFNEIQKQTPYRFVYTSEQLDGTKKVSLSVERASLETVLEHCFKEQPLSYSIEEKFIIVRKKEKAKNNNPILRSVIDVTGKVVNERGDALEGITVAVKATRIVTTTNADGLFELKDIEHTAVLLITSIGFEPQEIIVTGKGNLLINLKIATSILDETIVKGYYSTTQRLNTGSVGKITAETISKQPVSNVQAALQGRIPGLFITQGSGLPGANFSVLIRGQNSIQNGNNPLYIIDGVPFLSSSLAQRSGSLNTGNPFNSIDPANIESIEVLKDADATAIYGSRGANGVILITTKKASAEKGQLEIELNHSWSQVTRTLDYLNTNQYIALRKEAFANDNVLPTLSNAYDLLAWDTNRYTDWKKVLIGRTANIKNARLRYTAGTNTTRFTLAGSYNKENTVFPGDAFDRRTTFDANLLHHSRDKNFSISMSASYSDDQNNLIPTDLTQYISIVPNAPSLYDSLGKLNWTEKGFSYNNPLAVTKQMYSLLYNRLAGNAVLSYKMFTHLTAKLSFGYNSLAADESVQNPIQAQNPATNPRGSAFFGNSFTTGWIIEPQLEYNTFLGKQNKLETLIGSTLQDNRGKSNLTTGSGYTNDAMLSSINGASTISATNSFNQYRYEAVYARFGFNRAGRYLLNLTGRRDGSSRFGSGKQFANFGAIGTAWIFSEEPFIKKQAGVISFGKIRASYGITGSDQIGDYQYLDSYSPTLYPYQSQSALRPTQLYNKNYSWEQIRKLEWSVEFGFWKDRLLLKANWFKSKSENQIIFYSLPTQTGFTGITSNFPGVIQNKGWELELNSINIQQSKQFKWSSSFNITIPENKLISFPGLETSSYASSYVVGRPLNIRMGYQYTGLNTQTGLYTFDDTNKDGQYTSKDYTYLGTTNPTFYGGLQNSWQFKGWQLDVFFQFVEQKGIHALYSSSLPAGLQGNLPVDILDRWRQPGDNTPYQKFTQGFGTPAFSAALLLPTSAATITDASYVRLKNISLSYNLSSKIIKKIKLQGCKLYLQSQNLLTITSYEGPDPENQSRVSLPPLRVINVGFQLTFK